MDEIETPEAVETEKNIWNKTADELTVAESLKITAGATIVAMVVPVMTLMAAGAVLNAKEKFQARRSAKKAAESENETKLTPVE